MMISDIALWIAGTFCLSASPLPPDQGKLIAGIVGDTIITKRKVSHEDIKNLIEGCGFKDFKIRKSGFRAVEVQLDDFVYEVKEDEKYQITGIERKEKAKANYAKYKEKIKQASLDFYHRKKEKMKFIVALMENVRWNDFVFYLNNPARRNKSAVQDLTAAQKAKRYYWENREARLASAEKWRKSKKQKRAKATDTAWNERTDEAEVIAKDDTPEAAEMFETVQILISTFPFIEQEVARFIITGVTDDFLIEKLEIKKGIIDDVRSKLRKAMEKFL